MDFKKHPDHYYHFGNARRAEDMWRYFAYARQVLPHHESYLPGDIVFFDWEVDGVMDHVALISQVDQQGRPRAMIDATGEINDNPNGLAEELAWEEYHEKGAIAHARWTGVTSQPETLYDPDLPLLLVAVDSPKVRLRLLNAQGQAIGQDENNFSGGVYRGYGLWQTDQPERRNEERRAIPDRDQQFRESFLPIGRQNNP